MITPIHKKATKAFLLQYVVYVQKEIAAGRISFTYDKWYSELVSQGN